MFKEYKFCGFHGLCSTHKIYPWSFPTFAQYLKATFIDSTGTALVFIKTHCSEPLGQEEAACMCAFKLHVALLRNLQAL